MKAIVHRSYGSPDVLQYEEIEKPTAGNTEVLIRVHAASVNPLDWKTLTGGPAIVRKLLELGKVKIQRAGVDVAGEVQAVGRNVKQCKPGDVVFGVCRGAFAEYACAGESKLARKPDNVTFEQAAAAPIAGLTALQGLRDKAKIQPGQTVLINGAAGGVGTFAVQIAKELGAEVTGVCSTRNVDMVRSIGANRVIDYTQEDFTKSGQRYDVFFDLVGNHSLLACRRVLNRNGILLMAGAPGDARLAGILARVIGALVWSWFVSQKMVTFLARANKEDLILLGELMASRKVTPVIDRRYGLEGVAEALRYLEKGHARGKVLIWNDQSTASKCFSFFSYLEAAQVAAEAAIATVDHSDIRGSKPHNRDPSGAASD
jgi:NADPH:quinone reductase-like Zn-dependent oxidoreductase